MLTTKLVLRCAAAFFPLVCPADAGPVHAQSVFAMEELAPGIHAAVVVPQPAAYAFANSLIVIGADGVLVVDTQQSLTAAWSLIREIRSLTTLPVRWVVNTHWHGDHVNGNQAYVAAFPDVQIIAHASLIGDLDTLRARRSAELSELPAAIEQRQRWLEQGTGPDGVALTETMRAAIRRSADLRRAYLADLKRTDPAPPSRLVHDSLLIDMGDRRVRLVHPGAAHTRGDLIVFIEESGILAPGDLLEADIPYFGDSFPLGWLEAVRRIRGLGATVFVPAHGAVQRDNALLQNTTALLTQVQRSARCLRGNARRDAGGCTDSLAVRVLQEQWKRVYDVDAAAFRRGFDTAVARALAEADR